MHSKTTDHLEKFDNQHDFERMCADILNAQGYKNVVLIAPRGGSDGGQDITFTTESGEKALACVTLRKDIENKFREDFHQRKPGDYDRYVLFCTAHLTATQKKSFTRYCLDNLDAEFIPQDIEALRSLLDSAFRSIREQYLYETSQENQTTTPLKLRNQPIFDHLFTAPRLSLQTEHPYFVLGLFPSVPLTSGRVTPETDEAFEKICRDLFSAGDYFTHHNGAIIYSPQAADHYTKDISYAVADIDGAIAFKIESQIGHEGSKVLPFVGVWIRLYQYLQPPLRWPREVCDYSGKLTLHIGMGGLYEVYAVGPFEPQQGPPTILNRDPSWYYQTTWSVENDLDDLIDDALTDLAMKLNFRGYERIKHKVRDEAIAHRR